MNSEELLPCPFCGGKAQLSDGGYSGEQFLLRCSSRGDDEINNYRCPASSGKIYKTEKEAISSWNSRSHSQAWIPITERLPTEKDADRLGFIIAHSIDMGQSTVCVWHHILDDDVTSHWMSPPEPPEINHTANHAILIVADDWEGLFVNEKLVEEGHTLNQGYDRIKYFQKLAKRYKFNLEKMETGYVTENYERFLEDSGGFNKVLCDVQYVLNKS